jgi:hypothetical protein
MYQHWLRAIRRAGQALCHPGCLGWYLDLYILALAALTFTILGFVGIADIKVLASGILALLAYSQIRSRRHIADIAAGQRSDPLSIFQTRFPAEQLHHHTALTPRGRAVCSVHSGGTVRRTS